MPAYYPMDDLYLNIARGLVKGTKAVYIFGAVPSMSTSANGSIWDVNDTSYPWSAFNTANTITVDAVNSGDNGKNLTVYGLDINGNETSETIILSSAANTTSNTTFSRVFNCFYNDLGTHNAAEITIRKAGTVINKIPANQGQTLNATYTIPAGYTGYLLMGSSSLTKGGDATVKFLVRTPADTHFRVNHTFELADGAQYKYEFKVPAVLPALSDLDINALVRTNNSRVTVAYDIILIKDNLGP